MIQGYNLSEVLFVNFQNVISFHVQMNYNNLIQVNNLNVRKTFGLKFQQVSLSKCGLCLYCDESCKSVLSSGFKQNGRHLQTLFLPDMMWEGTWGGINQLLQKWTFGLSARAARL